MQVIRVAIVGLVIALLCLGQSPPPTSAPDPYMLNETFVQGYGYPPNRNTSGLSLGSQTINSGIANLVLIVAGQSNIDNFTESTAYSPTNPTALDNLNIYDSAIYKAVAPLLGTSFTLENGGSDYVHSGLILADALVTAGKFARVIIIPVAIGSTSVADWGGGSAVSGDPAVGLLTTRIPVAIARLTQRGITCGSTNVTCAIIWGQGEADNFLSTSAVNYVASFNNMVTLTAAAGFVGRWFVAKQTYFNGSADATVQGAQTNASGSGGVINNSAGIYLGANADALVGNVCNPNHACRFSDNTHFTYNGQVAYATDVTYGWQQAMHASGAPF